MKLLSIVFIGLLLISGCDNSPPTAKKETSPPWGRWLPPDAEHSVKRLEVKFGSVLYQIPVTYLVGEGGNERVGDPSTNKSVYLVASYPDLVPVHEMHDRGVPEYPEIQVILGGYKDDPYTKSDLPSNKEEPYPGAFANEIKKCGDPAVSSLAKDMYQYTCNFKNGQLYFTPSSSSIRTPVGYKIYIGCFDSLTSAKCECAIHSRLFDDGRYQTTRIYLDDLSTLLDVYHKTLKLLLSLEAPNQEGQ